MKAETKTRAAYWVFTLLFALPLLASGVMFLAGVPPLIDGLVQLGYPIYLAKFLGTAKILGALTIALGMPPKIKEWAYAGFAFNLLGATYSHLASGNRWEAMQPIVFLAFGVMSYLYWKKLSGATVTAN